MRFALACLIGMYAAAPAYAQCFLDVQGNDDEPGQKDLSEFCYLGTCNTSDFKASWNLDDTNWNGANTGDACALFDTDSPADGNANRAVCVTIVSPNVMQSGNPKCYTCGNTRPDRCTNSVLVACTSTCSVTSGSDPFAGAATHLANKCNGTDCLTIDTTTSCCITANDTGSGQLIDTCSYPSQEPNSDPSDCVVSRQCSKTDPNDPACNDNNPCTVDTCDTAFGVCRHVTGNQGTQCRGSAGACDTPEYCDGTSIACPADQFAQSGECRPATDLCDEPESCDGTSKDCPADGVQQGGVCRPSTGQCDKPESCDGVSKACPADGFQPDNTLCDDGSECTTGDTCKDGQCVGGQAPNCDDGEVCTDDTCNPQTPGGCEHSNNSASCSDGSECTTGDTCRGGQCVGGPEPNCDDGNVCTDDTCNPQTPGGCEHTNNSVPCSDANDCTTNDHCSGGQCVGGPEPNCDDGLFCTTDSCVAPTGCKHEPQPNCCDFSSQCVEAPDDKCTTNERCENHACVSDPVNCDDGNVCTDEECHPADGCVYTNNSASCSDGSECTTGDTCKDGQCKGGPEPNCDDGNVCTDDTCDPQTPGGCVHNDNTVSCSDGSECTTNDQCSGGECVGGPAPDCDDGELCTDDTCDPQTPGGCVHTNNTNQCDDGNGCTLGDVCAGGHCTSGTTEKNCHDLNPCTDDFCSVPSGECVHTDNNAPCDDGNGCTLDDRCAGGECQSGDPNLCNDFNDCTIDFCSSPSGACVHDPVGGCCNLDPECGDEDPCTINERCVDHSCLSDPVNCDDGDECTIDHCDSQGGGFLCVNDNCLDLEGQPCPGPQCFPPIECGNDIIEPEGGETCDPPGSTQFNGNPCRSDCTYCGDGNVEDGESCDDGNTVSGCRTDQPQKPLDDCLNDCTQPTCKDPAKVVFASLIDMFYVHGRLVANESINFSTKNFTVELTTSSGHVFFRSSLLAGSIVGDPLFGTFRFVDKTKTARQSGGIAKLKVKRQADAYRISVWSYGNLYDSEADMVTHFYVTGNEWTVHCNWVPILKGWRCRN